VKQTRRIYTDLSYICSESHKSEYQNKDLADVLLEMKWAKAARRVMSYSLPAFYYVVNLGRVLVDTP